jgi:CspA family cold shock protein
MNPTIRLVISLVIGAGAAAAYGLATSGQLPSPLLFAAFCAATVITALLPTGGAASSADAQPATPAQQAPTRPKTSTRAAAAGDREQGEVKWFNVSKGFGFIVKDDGEEIFVHFRSIRGEGRRSLRDGQRVSFVVTQSEKGPQAEDVEAL